MFCLIAAQASYGQKPASSLLLFDCTLISECFTLCCQAICEIVDTVTAIRRSRLSHIFARVLAVSAVDSRWLPCQPIDLYLRFLQFCPGRCTRHRLPFGVSSFDKHFQRDLACLPTLAAAFYPPWSFPSCEASTTLSAAHSVWICCSGNLAHSLH